MKKLLILHGPNLNLLGIRQPHIYGTHTLGEINAQIKERATQLGLSSEFFQSNWEGALIDIIHAAYGKKDGLIFNPAAFTHYSYALADAVAAVKIPVIEVHLSDIKNRESFRSHSVIAPYCHMQISGHGIDSYLMALEEFNKLFSQTEK